MQNIQNIIIGQGLGDLRFGMSMDEVRDILGDPDEIEKYTDDEEDDNLTETWHYDEQELSLSFDEMTGWILVTIAVSSVDYAFEGLKLIGLSYDSVMQKVKKLELGDMVSEDITDDEGLKQKLVSFDDVAVSFWFEEDLLSEIIWAPVWDDEI
ncbi:hypothetical protein [Saccharicrinis sp. FJH54]|uniref:hypothetical protein n=1 Tax=Saccharicrinis sp. FJH54 TaxID=3344665 RepID=UPI0035D4B17D